MYNAREYELEGFTAIVAAGASAVAGASSLFKSIFGGGGAGSISCFDACTGAPVGSAPKNRPWGSTCWEKYPNAVNANHLPGGKNEFNRYPEGISTGKLNECARYVMQTGQLMSPGLSPTSRGVSTFGGSQKILGMDPVLLLVLAGGIFIVLKKKKS